MKKLNQIGFGAIEALLILIIVSIVGGTGIYVYKQKNNNLNVSENSLQPTAKSDTGQDHDSDKVDLTVQKGLITYPENGVIINSSKDTLKLTGASDSFKKFIAGEINKLTKSQSNSSGCDVPYSITVKLIYNDLFASGTFGACGGAGIVWKNISGSWQEIATTQDSLECKIVEKYQIPKVIQPTCYVEKSDGSSTDRNNAIE